MRFRIGVTDNDWFRFLRERPLLDEVNFWQPSGGRRFRALSPGELLLFKLHAPENFIVGGGVFAHFSRVGHRTAWEWFGEANGVPSLEVMRRRIGKYRRQQISPFEEVEIGCIMLSQPFFWPERDWIPIPEDFALNIVQGKTYDTGDEIGKRLWDEVQLRRQGMVLGEASPSPWAAEMYGPPRLVRPRLGQGTFRSLVTDIYARRCAVTGEKALPVLEAGHIRPVSEGGQHEASNGLLLRSDLHRLFDRGYVTVTPRGEFRVSGRLKTDFENGEPYYPLEGKTVQLPPDEMDRPSAELLEWHSDAVFLR
jgi:putative restriction endonuclease